MQTIKMLKKLLLVFMLISALEVLFSCREGYTVPFYVGCLRSEEPFAYIDSSGQLTGMEVEIINAIAEDQGIWVEFETCTQEEILSELDSRRHKIECGIGMIEWTTAREQIYSFVSPSYYTSSLCIAVAGSSTGISSASDLKGRSLAVRRNSLAATHARSMADSIGFSIVEFSTSDEVIKAVESGQTDALEEEYPLIQYRTARKNSNLRVVENGVKNISFAIITQKDEDQTLRRYLRLGLGDIYDSGKLQEIIDKYMK